MNRPPRITDLCLVTRDLESATAFYVDRLGFQVASMMPGFVDFHGPGLILALWDATKIRETTGVPADLDGTSGHQTMVAVELASIDELDSTYEDLKARGVSFYGPPKDYPWNARCIYFAGPCGEFWEYFTWLDGGKPGQVAP